MAPGKRMLPFLTATANTNTTTTTANNNNNNNNTKRKKNKHKNATKRCVVRWLQAAVWKEHHTVLCTCAHAEHMINTNAHTTIHNPHGIAGGRSSTISEPNLTTSNIAIWHARQHSTMRCRDYSTSFGAKSWPFRRMQALANGRSKVQLQQLQLLILMILMWAIVQDAQISADIRRYQKISEDIRRSHGIPHITVWEGTKEAATYLLTGYNCR